MRPSQVSGHAPPRSGRPAPHAMAGGRLQPLPAHAAATRGFTNALREPAMPYEIKTRAKPAVSAPDGAHAPRPRPLELLTVKEAATCAKVSPQTIRRMIKRGDLKIYRAGHQIRIDTADLFTCITPQDLQ
jgi:excisionase family DNA binding protein